MQEFETTLDEPLAVRTFDIERVIWNQPVETAPGVRIEGDTTIYPLVEEQLILTKHLVLKEEVRVTKRETERRDTQTVVLRREHLAVERQPNETANVAIVEVQLVLGRSNLARCFPAKSHSITIPCSK